MNRARNIVIAGEIWSSNLGDGVIADSMRFLLQQIHHDIRVDFLDISGRDGLSPSHRPNVSPVRKIAQSRNISRTLLNALRWRILERRYAPRWTSMLDDADVVLIGGGQLLMDNALDFPLKVSAVSRIAHSLGKPAHIVSCGVGKKWSLFASRLFRNVLAASGSVSTRDTLSVERLQQFAPGTTVALSADPALWSACVYGQAERADQPVAGLGIINLELINRHSHFRLSHNDLVDFWVEIARGLLTRNVTFELFTNGSPDDHEIAQQVRRAIETRLSISCPLVNRPATPNQLARIISGYRAIIASRLHAHIVATSYRIPSIALVWDEKVRTFFKDTGREELAIQDFSADSANMVVARLCDVMDGRVRMEILDEQRALVLENLHRILSLPE